MPGADRTSDSDLAIMREAAREAGALALGFAARGDTQGWDKAPDHPVTAADLAVNRLLADRLLAARPDYGWLSEETADRPEDRLRRRVWVVDPIDGTRAFMRGGPDWCIGLAVVEDGRTVASVVHAPVPGELFEAERGCGARLNGAAISVSAQARIEGSRLVVSRSLVDHPAWRDPWPAVTVPEPNPNATLYRMALVAAGRWDASFVLFRKSDWDLAAGALLVEEAGGFATTHAGEPFRFNRTVPAQRSMLAAGKDLHPLLVRRMKAVALPDPNADSETAQA